MKKPISKGKPVPNGLLADPDTDRIGPGTWGRLSSSLRFVKFFDGI
jgi:hypothetical protein